MMDSGLNTIKFRFKRAEVGGIIFIASNIISCWHEVDTDSAYQISSPAKDGSKEPKTAVGYSQLKDP